MYRSFAYRVTLQWWLIRLGLMRWDGIPLPFLERRILVADPSCAPLQRAFLLNLKATYTYQD